MKRPSLLDQYGRPVQRSVLTEEVGGATLGGVRSPVSGYPADGLNPQRLAAILRAADMGDPVRYMELAETIEERDLHYLGVIGTRRRSVSQIPITVVAGSDSAEDDARADQVRRWIDREELQADLFDILDCIGKGYSGTEIVWDTSMGQWEPQRLEWRDPRWFRFADHDLTTPQRLADDGTRMPLEPFKWIWAQIKAKSGLPLRGGLARAAAWAWMFKAFTQRDWAIFTQTYAQPLRLGKWKEGASEEDKATLFRAVANIAGDMAAIIPESMTIEFVEAGNVGAAHALYKERADWLDQQVSKAVLGQTATTDAVTGGLGSGKEHRQVQEDIERADAKALAAILNAQLIVPWMQLQYGPLPSYPRIKIERPEDEDLASFASAIAPLIDRGLPVSQKAVLSKFNLPEPKPDEALLTPLRKENPPAGEGDAAASERNREIKRVSGKIKPVEPSARPMTALQAKGPSEPRKTGVPDLDELTDRVDEAAQPEIAKMIGEIQAMLKAAGSYEEFQAMLVEAFPSIGGGGLSEVMAQGMVLAEITGRIEAAAGGND